MNSKHHLINRNDLIKLINNQGSHMKFYVELAHSVSINFKHIRPRKRKGDKIPAITFEKTPSIITFD